MKDVLNVTPRAIEKTIIDTANSLIEQGVIKRSKKHEELNSKAANGANTENGNDYNCFFFFSVMTR